ncbi:MAG TPA: alpha-glucuronidase, partial [Cyclobacteriaceae bacterium]|nr:alpha-glucuronidase [Cyclobacteriaceae bacterium]
SIWDWHRLPQYVDPRYTDYARANASIGINGTVLTNVNANALLITPMYLEKVKVLADLFRPYNLKVYLTARFSAPMEIGGLKTADPLDPEVRQWWKTKVDEIYKYVPDFGGFVVKANSEGQPGPQNYSRTHADGANMLAEAVAPHNGIVMWRAFVYDSNVPDDRAKQAYSEFKPLDGKFNDNVIVQVKNGPIDFMPREPVHPLFGAMKTTPLMMELQITQEYLGQATTLVFLPMLWKENIDQADLKKSNALKAICGVSNIGNDRNWTGHLFGQSNWYGFGRLAWDYETSSLEIANDWTRMTFTNNNDVVKDISWMMITSHETVVKYMTPLGLHHIMGANHHFGPGPWVSKMSRSDWTSTYYHKADSLGIGFNRTSTGSNAIEQYSPETQKKFNDEKFLLWFNHVPWDHKMKSGQTLWDEICTNYAAGVEEVKGLQKTWSSLASNIDADRFKHVTMLLERQKDEAELWRNSCILYFQTFSKRALPNGVDTGNKPLEYYINLSYPYAPGIRPRW